MNEQSSRRVSPDPIHNVTAIVKRSGTSFYWAMRLLPAKRRDAMFAIYAFCREVDDIADGPDTPDSKMRALDVWQAEIDGLYAGHPTHPIAVALAAPVAAYALARQDFNAILAGMRMDAVDRLRLADSAELALYCDRVACAVGRLSCAVFGVAPATGTQLAAALGEALQLTNILRDVHEDALRDRVYLPADLLRRHGITDVDSATLFGQSGLAAACRELAELAERRFAEAEQIMRGCDRRAIRPALIMKTVYHDVLRRLNARGWDSVSRPVHQSKLRKCGLIARSLLAI